MTCKNILFNRSNMSEMHDSMTRLYKFVRERKQASTQADLAKAMGATSQVINNWEARGISQRGANTAQKKFGCDANWLLGRSQTHVYLSAEELAANMAVVNSSPAPWVWPFKKVQPDQYSLLSKEEQEHIENDILLRVKNRGDPIKQGSPAQNNSPSQTA